MQGRKWLQGQAIVVIAFGVACGSPSPVATTSVSPVATSTMSASPGPTPTSTVKPTAGPSPTPSPYRPPPSPTPSAILDDGFGFVLGGGVKRESDLQTIFSLGIGSVGGAVSPDGRQFAYWVKSELRVIDIKPSAQPRKLLSVTAKGEYALYLAWSSDSTGVVVGVNGAPPIAAADAPPAYTALRVVDVAGGPPREIARIAGANVVPLAWDRTAQLIGAYEPVCCGTRNYDTITEDGVVKRVPPTLDLFFFKASHDAKFVFGTNMQSRTGPFPITTLLRIWPIDAYEAGITIQSMGGKPIRTAEWRPGTDEIAVLFDDRLELWTPNGMRRTISLPSLPRLAATNPNASLLFRADGKAVFISLQTSTSASAETVAVDLESGASEYMMWGGFWPATGTSVRLSSPS